MRLIALVLVLVASGCARRPASLPKEQAEQNLFDQAEELGRAVAAEDHGRMADLSHPELVRQMGGREKYARRLGEIAAEIKGSGFRIEKFAVSRPTALVAAGRKWFGVVPCELELSGPGGVRGRTKSHQIADSVDGGRTWRFVDANGVEGDRQKLKLVIPDFPDSVPVPEKTTHHWGD